MINFDKEIGLKIKEYRKKLGLQAKKLAQQINISPSYLNLIESGKRKIDGDLLLKISQELRIDFSEISLDMERDINNSKKAIANLTEIGVALLALAIVASLLVGASNMAFFGGVVGNITSLVSQLGNAGLAGLISLGVVLWLFQR